MAPLALGALRREEPDRDRPFRLPAVGPRAVRLRGREPGRLLVELAHGLAARGRARDRLPRLPRLPAVRAPPGESQPLDLRSAAWLPPYLVGIALISWLGRYDGREVIPDWVDLGVVAVFSIAIFALAIALRLRPDHAQEYISVVSEEAAEEEAALESADEPLRRERDLQR